VSDPIGRSLVPPRPNLGPELWPKERPYELYWLAAGIPALAIIGWIFWKLVRRPTARSGHGAAAAEQVDPTPRGRLVALANSTKNALAAQFGPTWRAKTTEELAADPVLAEVLGPAPLGELIEFLDGIDRLKFAPERPNGNRRSFQEDFAKWDPRIAEVITKIKSRANGRPETPARRRGKRLAPRL
jgi:hypothetical protein